MNNKEPEIVPQDSQVWLRDFVLTKTDQAVELEKRMQIDEGYSPEKAESRAGARIIAWALDWSRR